jgi:hypothetical protein
MRPIPSARRTLAGVALALAGVTTALSTSTAFATTSPRAQALPPGVIKLNDGEQCPPATLCAYRAYNYKDNTYGIGAGYHVRLSDLPATPQGTGGPNMANNVSSWVNNTSYAAYLIDTDRNVTRELPAHQRLQEPPQYNDTVDVVAWHRS